MSTFYVWRRSTEMEADGFVGCTVFRPADWTQPNNGHRVTFEVLAEIDTSDVNAKHKLAAILRKERKL